MLGEGDGEFRCYVDFVKAGMEEPHEEEMRNAPGIRQQPAGSERCPDFVRGALASAEKMPRRTVPIEAIVEAVERTFGITRAEMTSPGRGRAAARARAATNWVALRVSPGGSTKRARVFGRSSAALSRGAVYLEEEARNDPHLRGKLEDLVSSLARSVPGPEGPIRWIARPVVRSLVANMLTS
jgi:hypothetical protein